MSGENSGLALVGVGGGGCRFAAAARMLHGEGMMDALGFDTDETTQRAVPELRCQLIGATRLNKQGAGGVHTNGRLAAQDDLPQMLAQLKDARIVVVVASLGGGTGGGATPVLLKALRAEGKITLCFATLPFAFEGPDRRQTADRDRPFLEQNADTLVAVPLDELHAGMENRTVPEAGERASEILAAGLSLLWRLLLSPGYIRLDAARLENMLVSAGSARFAQAAASGENRCEAVVAELARAPLLRRGDALAGARALVLGILAGPDLRLAEIAAVMDRIRAACRKDIHLEMGVALDARFEGRIELVALAYDTWVPTERRGDGSEPGGERLGALLGKEGHRDGKLAIATGKFRNVEKTVHKGEDLDIPAYQRQHLRLER
jgi:cell division protein FtsZ